MPATTRSMPPPGGLKAAPSAADHAHMGKLLVLVVVAAVVWGIGHERTKHTERRLAAIASEIAQRPVGVHCQGFLAELVDVSSEPGRVEFDRSRPADHTDLQRKVCRALDRLRTDAAKPALACLGSGDRCPTRVHQEVWAATVLAHESIHLAGQIREDVAECQGIQRTALVAQRLGAAKDVATAVGRYAWKQVYPQAREDYRSLDCFNGGPYDLRPADPLWP